MNYSVKVIDRRGNYRYSVEIEKISCQKLAESISPEDAQETIEYVTNLAKDKKGYVWVLKNQRALCQSFFRTLNEARTEAYGLEWR